MPPVGWGSWVHPSPGDARNRSSSQAALTDLSSTPIRTVKVGGTRGTLGVLLILLVTGALDACQGNDPQSIGEAAVQSAKPSDGNHEIGLPAGATVELPTGWHLIRGSIDGVTEPTQVLAVASYPTKPDKSPPAGCAATRVLEEMPAAGALIEVVETTQGSGDAQHPNLAKYPERQRPFRLTTWNYRPYECNGLSYNVSFRDRDRAFQAFVWMNPRKVSAQTHDQAIRLLDSIRFDRSTRVAPASHLTECPADGGRTSAAAWAGRVEGISCSAAGTVIQDHLIPAFQNNVLIAIGGKAVYEPGTFTTGDYRCEYEVIEHEGWSVRCERGTSAISFEFTP